VHSLLSAGLDRESNAIRKACAGRRIAVVVEDRQLARLGVDTRFIRSAFSFAVRGWLSALESSALFFRQMLRFPLRHRPKRTRE
jgi:hypothetical protein